VPKIIKISQRFIQKIKGAKFFEAQCT